METIHVSKLVEEDRPWSSKEWEDTRSLLPSHEVPMGPANAIVQMGIPGRVTKNRLIFIALTQNQSNHSQSKEEVYIAR